MNILHQRFLASPHIKGCPSRRTVGDKRLLSDVHRGNICSPLYFCSTSEKVCHDLTVLILDYLEANKCVCMISLHGPIVAIFIRIKDFKNILSFRMGTPLNANSRLIYGQTPLITPKFDPK